MKLHQIALAVATLAAGAAQAAAIAPNLVVYLDGATATKQSVIDVASYMCKDGATGATTKLLSNSADKIDGVYCSAGVKSDTGLATSTKVFLVKNNKDGSLETFERALMHHAQTKTLQSNIDDTCGTTCATTLVDAHGGFSDVDEKVWIGRGQFNPAEVSGGYTVKAGFAGQGFGIVVTQKLYDALQTAQGLPVDATEAHRPNITTQQFTAILSESGGYKYDWAPILGAAGVDQLITLCRRTPASGTQASMDSYFLANPCHQTNYPTFGSLNSARAVDFPADYTSGMAVIENAGTGDVKTCLITRNSIVDAVTPELANTKFAIGVASLENAEAPGSWKYVKLDGVSPVEDAQRRASVIDGRYNFAEEMVLAYRNDAPANVKTYLSNFAKVMSDPRKVAPLPGIWTPNGANLGSGVYATHASLPAYADRIHRGTRGGNACKPFQLFE